MVVIWVVRNIIFLLLMISWNSTVCWGKDDPSGYVSAVRGEAYLINASGITMPLTVRAPISKEDFIVTEKSARVKIVFQDNTIVTLGENSRVKLSDYSWSEKDKKGSFKVSINEGFFRIIGGKITKNSPENFVAKTPAASIGIRGSSYAGRVKGKGLQVFLTEGKGIDVSNKRGSVALLKPGMGTTVADDNSAPATPFTTAPSDMFWMLEGSAIGGDSSQGSVIGPNGKVINQAVIKNSVNIAIGKDNSAQMGSIRIKGSTVNGTIVNKADISDSANISIGTGNSAIMGSTEAE